MSRTLPSTFTSWGRGQCRVDRTVWGGSERIGDSRAHRRSAHWGAGATRRWYGPTPGAGRWAERVAAWEYSEADTRGPPLASTLATGGSRPAPDRPAMSIGGFITRDGGVAYGGWQWLTTPRSS